MNQELKDLYARLGELTLNIEFLNAQYIDTKKKILEIANKQTKKEGEPNADIS